MSSGHENPTESAPRPTRRTHLPQSGRGTADVRPCGMLVVVAILRSCQGAALARDVASDDVSNPWLGLRLHGDCEHRSQQDHDTKRG